ncbi:parallel beta-helix domain-containing protein [Lunatimonas salinarum]|uniref:parallel beta-helix domain-containing protein n=1 Tax=Lunatimonas salinarum TaxID=1774590 RepID=UPI001ADFA1C6|nr:parallel beta-helix domain-containing protein [Lunatimonas salinarum]
MKFARFAFLPMLLLAIGLHLASCQSSSSEMTFDSSKLRRATAQEVEKVIEAFILAEDGAVIEIPAGFYELKTQLIIERKKNVRITGAGMAETVLSFRNLRTGGEGVKLVGDNISIEDLSIEDAPGDGVKAQHCDGITFRRVNVTWTNGDKSKNGTYAIYPVQCRNVLIDGCIASHSKDAGIYVGQSENIIVKNSLAFGNVAGIEIENSDNAEVFGNTARDNSGGILVFNLPGLPKAEGRGTRIYDNDIVSNNHVNFAVPMGEGPNGNTVTMIPPGSGVILLAAKEVEIFNNRIHKNKTVGVAITNYHVTGFPTEAPNWSPYTSGVYIHENDYKRTWKVSDFSKEFGQLITMYNAHGIGKSQDIIYDGFWDKSLASDWTSNPMQICIQERLRPDLRFTRFDLYEGEDAIKAFKDYGNFDCQLRVHTDVSAISTR